MSPARLRAIVLLLVTNGCAIIQSEWHLLAG